MRVFGEGRTGGWLIRENHSLESGDSFVLLNFMQATTLEQLMVAMIEFRVDWILKLLIDDRKVGSVIEVQHLAYCSIIPNLSHLCECHSQAPNSHANP